MSSQNGEAQRAVRLRFLAQHGMTPKRQAILNSTTEVTFLAMEAIDEQGHIDTSWRVNR